MIPVLSIVMIVLLLTILAGLVRVFRGPDPAERMLAAQLFGTTSVAILLILAKVMQMPALLDVALVFAVLAAVTIICFVILTTNGSR